MAEQRPLQCTRSSSCRGGYPKYALQNITAIGLPTESAFPYKNSDSYYSSNQICSAGGVKLSNNIIGIYSYYRKGLTDTQLKQWLYDYGPIGVGIRSRDAVFRTYGGGGVMTGCASTVYIDHVVLLVGWTEEGWIIKNSWGKNWGD